MGIGCGLRLDKSVVGMQVGVYIVLCDLPNRD